MDMRSEFPEGRKAVLLTRQAATDPDLVAKMQKQLMAGGEVFITTGLLEAAPEKVAEICELRTDYHKAIVNDFGRYGKSAKDIIIPEINYLTNDSWEIISAGRPLTNGVSGYPFLHRAIYSQGNLYVIAIPEDFGNLYDLPEGVLNELRRYMSKDLDLYMEGPAKVSVFLYDNKTVIVENFNDEPVDVKLVGNGEFSKLTNLETGEVIEFAAGSSAMGGFFRMGPAAKKAPMTIKPHSYMAFSYE